MDGVFADQARKCLIQRERFRTCAGRATSEQLLDGVVQTFPNGRIIPEMPTLDFQLTSDHVELNQLLKLVGLCDSGGMGKTIVASGAVKVDGVVELRKTCKIRTGQVVRIGDVEVRVA